MKLIRQITLHKFPTHLQISLQQRPKYKDGVLQNPKTVGMPKMAKITFNALYSGNLHEMVRQKMMKFIHLYIKRQLRNVEPIPTDKPLVIRCMAYLPINYGSVRMIKGQLNWKAPSKDYKPNWDIFNFGVIWVKAIEDVLHEDEMDEKTGLYVTRKRLIPEDTVEYVTGSGEMRVRFIEEFDQRKIVINIYEDDDEHY